MRGLESLAAPLRRERGATIVLVALALTALLSVVALAIDIGMLFNSRSEAQRAATAGALAGAGSLITEPANEDRARDWAIEYAEMNDVFGDTPDVQEADVDVDLANGRVTVRVLRTADRGGGPVPTWFARVFGVDEVDVGADATAEVAPTGQAVCVKPFAIQDRYEDLNANGSYEPDEDEYDSSTTGWASGNFWGTEIVVKGSDDGTGSSWYQPWDIPNSDDFCSGGPEGQGASCYQKAIEECNPAGVALSPETYPVETGGKTGPTRKSVNNLLKEDPGNVSWDEDKQTIVGSTFDPWETSPRYGIVPVFNPDRIFNPGKKDIEFTNFVGLFFLSVEGGGEKQQVRALVVPAIGLLGGNSPASPTVQGVRLIE